MKDFKARGDEKGGGSRRWLRLRVRLVGGVFIALLGAVFARAVNLQIFDRAKLSGMAHEQYLREIEIPARRGDILDRHGAALAQSVEVDSIWIDPSMLDDDGQVVRTLAKKLKLDAAELRGKLEHGKRFAWLKRQATPAEVEAVKQLGLPAVGFVKEPKRFYPQRELAAQVVGLVGTDGHGLDGLELAFEDELSGEAARVAGVRDAKGRKLLMQGAVDPQEKQGAAVSLTLDRQIQYFTERSLMKAVDDAKAVAGVAVVMDPKTGELLAVAHSPRFNPNASAGAPPSALRDRAALDAFEPGSTFKSFVVAGGLEDGALKPDDAFFCENGHWTIGRHTIHDSHMHTGSLTTKRILQVSSNIGAAKIAQQLGRDRVWSYFGKFGFGEKTGLALPGEGRGSVPFPKADIQLATQSFGQGLTATAVQISAAYSALANGGVLMRPFLVSKVVDADGTTLLENKPTEVRRVVSAKTARTVVSMLEAVVEKEGTAPKAHMDEWRVAGKTGTAQKVDPLGHGYSDKRIASFVGTVPAEDPRLVILVVIDEPKTDVYGGLVAAPAFKEIAAAALPYLGVPAAVKPTTPVLAKTVLPRESKPAESPEPPRDAITDSDDDGSIEVPNVVGKPARDAVVSLLAAGVEPRVLGSGRVVSQNPSAGSHLEKGSRVTLELAARQ